MTLNDFSEYINRQLKVMPSCGSAIVCITEKLMIEKS